MSSPRKLLRVMAPGRRAVLCLLAAGLLAGCAAASSSPPEAVETRAEGLGDLSGRRVVLMPPEVEINVVHPGGFPELKAEWTARAEEFLDDHLEDRMQRKGIELLFASGSPPPAEAQIIRLHGEVARGILKNHYRSSGDLPTKQKDFSWSLGVEVRQVGERYGADYALFVELYENYPSETGKGALGELAGELYGLLSVYRWGYASLVDLDSGRIVWFAERDAKSPGLRERWEARRTIDAMLGTFPG